ncbi:hypothetical protein A2716_02415 [candidate division WWE3 bacterium RIFCSPHIGHO2_01_FULL_40_23]|uniref:Hemerythrin-like domain-containing protein n=1 Tax=candidate division WWE3 bacterium RIFCSPLOWO2_01_FULL_41_18 TaxID=1802625 RepID=A0A1F4VFA4_UNCKA|nr:MAG: hypothetical protein A2716_02415 [candidate division WWE3 bacterium RIFCSPHIGHO2_01_FULL_40_23]OGC55839.1 MAG: hypothetical protein A3A78_02265 [candidate division WWE3 bacterium RIFCSPLOWO2_01_FULL_41_18]
MAKLFKWDDKYSVKVPSLDEQHKHFFTLTNRILTMIEKRRNSELRESLIFLLVDLGNYALLHLDYEEDCMEKYRCSGCEDHPIAHAVYRDKVKQYLGQLKEESVDIYALAQEVAEFTQNWLSHHILRKDREYIDCLSPHNLP